MRTTHLMFFLVLMTWGIKAQETQFISKEAVNTAVQANNNSLKASGQEAAAAQAAYQQTASVFLPTLKASHTGMATTNPLMAFGSKLNQEILTSTDFDPNTLNNPSQIQDFMTKVEVQLPLINIDGIYQRKAAKFKWEASQQQEERTKEHLGLLAEKAYMQLQLSYRTLSVYEKSLKAAKANFQMAKDNFDAGYLQQSDVLVTKMRVTEIENKLEFAKSTIENASNYLSVLMDTSQDIIYEPSDSLKVERRLTEFDRTINGRADVLAMANATEARKQMHKASKMRFLPRLNAFGSYEWHDDQIFQAGANGYFFGAELSWNLFDGGKRYGKTKETKARYQKAKVEFEQYKAESTLELNKAYRQLEDVNNQLRLAKMAVDQAKEVLRIRTDRFEEGLEKTTEVMQAEALYAQKQLSYYQSIYEHNYAVAYVQFLNAN